MKTIEQFVKENSFDIYKTSLTDGQQLHVGEESKTEESILQAIEKGIKAGVEFAQRWIPVDEELPENDDRVLIKWDNGNCIVNSFDPFENKWQYDFEKITITHWRPIELK